MESRRLKCEWWRWWTTSKNIFLINRLLSYLVKKGCVQVIWATFTKPIGVRWQCAFRAFVRGHVDQLFLSIWFVFRELLCLAFFVEEIPLKHLRSGPNYTQETNTRWTQDELYFQCSILFNYLFYFILFYFIFSFRCWNFDSIL